MKIGIDIGGSHIAVGLINEKNELVAMTTKDLKKEEKQNIGVLLEKSLIRMIEGLIQAQEIKKEEIEKIGIAVPGRVDTEGKIYTVNLNLKDYPILDILQQNFNVPIQIRNDAKCSALYEKKYGSLKEYKDAVFLCLGTGIGSGVFLQNKLLVASSSEAFEIGHMIIKKDGEKCNCGKNGCFEKYAAMSVFKKKVQKLFKLSEETSGEEIFNIIKKEKNNKELKNIIEEYINNLSIGILNMIEIFEPDAVCIGGSFVYFKDVFLEKLKKNLDKQSHINKKIPKIVLAQMGNNAGIIGAVL